MLQFDLNNLWLETFFTRVSASKKTHLLKAVKAQQCNLVKVMPSSGLANNAK
jgi:hypothetical protein